MFWPGVVVVRVTAGPPMLIVPEASGGTSHRVKVSEPVWDPGSNVIV
jgi:hypothetical protein